MKKTTISCVGKTLCLFISLVLFSLTSLAQTPSANISGPLKARAKGANITVKSKIAFGSNNPDLIYTFHNNTSGAFIVSKGAYLYNPATDEGTQTIVINPGNSAGSFDITLEVKTSLGVGKCSKSVAVSNVSMGNTPNN